MRQWVGVLSILEVWVTKKIAGGAYKKTTTN